MLHLIKPWYNKYGCNKLLVITKYRNNNIFIENVTKHVCNKLLDITKLSPYHTDKLIISVNTQAVKCCGGPIHLIDRLADSVYCTGTVLIKAGRKVT